MFPNATCMQLFYLFYDLSRILHKQVSFQMADPIAAVLKHQPGYMYLFADALNH